MKVLAYFVLAIGLISLSATLFGNAGIWGFLAFLIATLLGVIFLLVGFAFTGVDRLREVLMPSTREAALRRRLMIAALKGPVRSEAGQVIDRLRRLEHVWPSIQGHLRKRLSPTELTFQRYEGTARQAWRRALLELEDATSLVESLAALKTGRTVGAKGAGRGREDPRQARREKLKLTLTESQQAISALERLDLALVSDLRTGDAARTEDLNALADELDRLASRARRYVTGD